MAKRIRKLNIDKRLKENRGLGDKNDYSPWIRIQDVPSLGRSSRFKGIKTGRQHDVLSDMERNYLYYLEYSDCVVDVKEQFPLLPIEETIDIAMELGVEHPKDPKTNKNIVMTTDFYISLERDNNLIDIARTIKSKDDLLDRRIIEKFEIERIYWERRGINWAIVTEQEINKTIAENIMYFNSYHDIHMLDAFQDIEREEITDLIFEFLRRIVDSNQSVRSISTLFDKEMDLLKGAGISIFKHLLSRKIIKTNISEAINIDKKMDINICDYELNKEYKVL